MTAHSLARIVRGSMVRWLLLPAIAGICILSLCWIYLETQDLKKQQRYYAQNVSDFVVFYLRECAHDLRSAVTSLKDTGSSAPNVLRFISQKSFFHTAFLLNQQGRVLMVQPGQEAVQDLSGLIDLPAPSGAAFLTTPYYSQNAQTMVVGMVKSISPERMILAELNLAELQGHIFALTTHMRTGFAFVTDSYGNILAHLDRFLVERQVNVGHWPILQNMNGREPASGFYTLSGDIHLLTAITIPFGDWNVLVQQDALTLLRPILWSAALFLISISLLLSLGIYAFKRRLHQTVLTPLSRFIHSMNAFKDNAQDVPQTAENAPVKTKGILELMHLEQTFQDMLAVIRERETALRQSEETYRNLFHNAQVGLFRTRIEDGKILECNDQLAHMFGFAHRREFIDHYKTSENYVDPGTRETMLHQLQTQGEVTDFEARFYRKDRSIFRALYSARIYPQAGWIEGVSQDITEQKEAEKERKRLQEQLIQSQKMESVGRLAGGVAHDFNNMLSVIQGHTDLLLSDTPADSQLREDLKEIRDAAQRSADLTRQLLAFARRQTADPQVLDLNQAIESMLKMLRRLIGEHIDLLWHPAPSLAPVFIDPAQLDQILANLVVNSRDAIQDRGSITLSTCLTEMDKDFCATYPGSQPGSYVLLALQDNGQGMDEDTQKHIFDPFFTTKDVGAGTGLGLSTVYGIVKQNHGYITVDSKPDAGTAIHIYLPVHTGGDTGEQEDHKGASDIQQGQGTILLVEDERSILSMGRAMLAKLGYHPLTASTPDQALRLAEDYQGHIDLVITDVVMPEMNGRELVHHLTALNPDLKHLFISGYTRDIISQHGVLDEETVFLPKPFTLQELSAKIKEVYKGP